MIIQVKSSEFSQDIQEREQQSMLFLIELVSLNPFSEQLKADVKDTIDYEVNIEGWSSHEFRDT